MFKRLQLSVMLLLAAPVMLVQAQEIATKKQPPEIRGTHGTASVTPTAATDDPNYIIGPQDVLDVDVWKEPEVTRTVPVRPDGRISLPLLNDVKAAGLTPMQLAAQITTSLKKFVADPQVTIVVSQINSQRIYILGEVNRPGALPLLPDMTMLEGLSNAGGFTIFAHIKKIYLIRKIDGKAHQYPFNYKDVIHGKAPEQNIPLKAGDTIVVP
jgi:polysaccharide biosynthesis/export protein